MDVHAISQQMRMLWQQMRASEQGMDGPEYHQFMALGDVRDSYLYERYGQVHYDDHYGKWIAISLDGAVLFEKTAGELIWSATEAWGAGNFCMRRLHECPGHQLMTPQIVRK